MAVQIGAIPKGKLHGAFDAGVHSLVPAERQELDENGFPILKEDGYPKTVRNRPRAPSQKWVTRSGNVIYLRVAGSGAKKAEQRYEEAKLRLHNNMGIRYGICPLADPDSNRWVPPGMRDDKPCPRESYSEQKCCHHIEEIIEDRIAHQNRLMQNSLMLEEKKKQMETRKQAAMAEAAIKFLDREERLAQEREAKEVKAKK